MKNKNLLVINMANGSAAYTTVPEDYTGPCKVSFNDQGESEPIAVMPSFCQAERLATFIISPEVAMEECVADTFNEPITHLSSKKWENSFDHIYFETELTRFSHQVAFTSHNSNFSLKILTRNILPFGTEAKQHFTVPKYH